MTHVLPPSTERWLKAGNENGLSNRRGQGSPLCQWLPWTRALAQPSAEEDQEVASAVPVHHVASGSGVPLSLLPFRHGRCREEPASPPGTTAAFQSMVLSAVGPSSSMQQEENSARCLLLRAWNALQESCSV